MEAQSSPPVYEGKKPLVCAEFPGLHRQVGVSVSPPFVHQGTGETEVEICTEYPTLNTQETARIVPLAGWKSAAGEGLRHIIKRLNTARAELDGHLLRLAGELESLADCDDRSDRDESFRAWRRELSGELPELCRRVFALREIQPWPARVPREQLERTLEAVMRIATDEETLFFHGGAASANQVVARIVADDLRATVNAAEGISPGSHTNG